ncbi:MAG TPA: trypsin-like peptidase domain-containing protein [Candidatus Binatia bacterium]|nr:trypsin-like peptidase domain-containing protein [Candidatus Binatia bacterium]
MKYAIRIILLLLVIGAVVSLAGNRPSRTWLAQKMGHVRVAWPTSSATLENRARIVCSQPATSFAAAAAAAKPAVVNVVAKRKIAAPPSLGLSPGEGEDEDSSGAPDEPSAPSSKPVLERKSLGSGFAIRGDGTIVTSRRAVEDAEQVTVRFANDPNPHVARVLGTDAATDLAVLKVSDAGTTPSLSFAEPGTTQAGDWVVAIGNPFGLEQTLTAGIVSATDRAVSNPPYEDFLQVNASLNPGDSGGPLLNVAGEVVGINSAVFRESGAGVGIAFALAGDAGRRLIDQLEANGRVIRPWLGVTVQDLNPDLAKALGLAMSTGPVVSEVQPGGPAAQGGIERGDVIVAYGPDEMRSARDLPRRVGGTPVGSRVEIRVVRDGRPRTLTAKLAEMPEHPEQTPARLLIGGSVVQAAARLDAAGGSAPAVQL